MLCLVSRFAAAQGYTVSGTVTLEGCYPPAIPLQPLTFTFVSTDNPYSFSPAPVYLAADGSFTISNVPADTYKVHIKGAKWLASVQKVDTTAGNVTGVTAFLGAGDADNSNTIDSSDFGILIGAFNSDINTPGSGYDQHADFDCDGHVDTNDFGLLIGEFNNLGALIPTPAIVVTDLKLSVTGVTAGASLMGTVTISDMAPTGGALLMLASSDPSVLLMSSVTVPAGATQSLPFPIATDVNAVSEPLTVTISASSGHWTQSTPLSVVPAGYDLSIQNLSVDPAKGAVLLNWTELPEGSVMGYTVYRDNVKVNANPMSAAVYVDNNVTNGQVHSYQVTVTDVNNFESPRTAFISAMASATAPTISWVSVPAPTASASGLISLYASRPAGDIPSVYLLVDGKIVTGFDTSNDDDSPFPSALQTNLNTIQLTNGTHTLQIAGYMDNSQAVVSPPVTIQTGNALGGINNIGVVETDSSDFASFDAPVPADTQFWRAELRDSNNNLVSDWQTIVSPQSSSSNVKLTWTGTDSSGNVLADGNYTFGIMVYEQSGIKQLVQNLIKISSPPTALSLNEYDYPNNSTDVTATEKIVAYTQGAFDQLTANGSISRGLAVTSKVKIPSQLLIRWLRNNLTIFHLYTHGLFGATGGVAVSAH